MIERFTWVRQSLAQTDKGERESSRAEILSLRTPPRSSRGKEAPTSCPGRMSLLTSAATIQRCVRVPNQGGGSVHRAVALFHPGAPEVGQRPRFQEFLSQGKDDAFLFVEVFARRDDRGHQAGAGQLEVTGRLHPRQVIVNFLVFLMEGFTVPDLFQAMVQRSDEQLLFDVRMGRE